VLQPKEWVKPNNPTLEYAPAITSVTLGTPGDPWGAGELGVWDTSDVDEDLETAEV